MTPTEILKLRFDAERLELSGRELLENTELVLTECNGVGAQWMGLFCGILSALNPALVLPSMIHDLRYYYGGSADDRRKADAEWLANAMICIDDRYNWYNPLRYILRWKAPKYYEALRAMGVWAWKGGGGT